MTPAQLADLRARASRPRRTVPIVTNGDLRQRAQDLDDELDRLEADAAKANQLPDGRLNTKRARAADPRIAELEAELADLHQRAEADTLHVVVEGVAGTPWRALLAEHPIRKDDEGKPEPADRHFGANVDTIREPAIRACIIGHRPSADADEVLPLDADTVDWLLEWVTDAQADVLWLAVLACCRGDDAVPLRRTRSTTPSSASA